MPNNLKFIVEFNFYGEGSLFDYLLIQERLININKKNIILKIHGWNSSPFTKGFNFLIIPSRWEGFPNVLIEGVQNKKIIIANNVGGIKDFASFYKTKYIKKIKDPKTLSSLIKNCLNLDKKEAIQIIRNQKKALKSFYEDNEVKCWQDFI